MKTFLYISRVRNTFSVPIIRKICTNRFQNSIPMMQLGFASAILPDLSLEQVFDIAAKIGYQCVEVMCWPLGKANRRYAGVTHIDLDQLKDVQHTEIVSLTQQKGINISALGYYPNPMDADEEKAAFYQNHLKKLIRAANELGIGQINTFIGRDQLMNEEKNLEKFEKIWTPLVKYAEEQQVKIGIENCPMYFTYDEWPKGQNLAYSPALWRKMFERIPSAFLGLNYDPSHLLWMQMDYLLPIYEFAERIFHVHIKDAKLHREKLNQVGVLANPLEFHTPKLPGLGDIQWGHYLSALHDVGYQGAVCVEVEDKAYEGSLEHRKLALVQSFNYLKQFFPL